MGSTAPEVAPRYAVSRETHGIRLEDRESGSSALIEPERGSNVTEFRVHVVGRPIDVLVSPDRSAPFRPNGYAAGIPVLFPFPGRVADGRFVFDGETYELDRNETGGANHIHGLVRGTPWTVVGSGTSEDRGVWIETAVEATPDTLRQYPFRFRLTLTTSLRGWTIEQTAQVANLGERTLPMGFGLHPWFPSHLGSGRSHTDVRAPARELWELRELIPTGRRVPAEDGLDLHHWRALGSQAFDDVLTGALRRRDGWSTAAVRYPHEGVEVIVEASPEFREWVVFAPGHREVVCLEPYTGAPNAVNLAAARIDAGLVVLEPSIAWHGTVRITARSIR